MRKTIFIAVITCALTACATVSENRIESSLKDIGVSPDKATCIGGELRDRLNSRQLGELADYLETLTRADSTGEGIDAVLDIEDAGIVAEVAASAITCALTPSNR